MPSFSPTRCDEKYRRAQPASSDQSNKISDSEMEEDAEEEVDPEEISEVKESDEDNEVNDDDDDEEEAVEDKEEEAEGEEVVEEEEEVEGEDEMEGEEEGEGEEEVSGSRQKGNKDRTDISCDMKYKGHGKHLESGATQGKTESTLSSKTLAVEHTSSNLKISGPSNEILMRCSKNPYLYRGEFNHLKTRKEDITSEESGSEKIVVDKKDAAALLVRKSPKDCSRQQRDGEDYFLEGRGTKSESPNPSRSSGTKFGVGVPITDCMVDEAKTIQDSDAITKPVDKLKDDKKRTASRSVTSEMRSLSLSPGFEIKDGNKRMALICDFFVKGWCIKGSSCKFLHVKDIENGTKQPEKDLPAANLGGDKSNGKQPEIDAPAARWISETQPDEGLRNTTETSRSRTFTDQFISTVGNSSALSSSQRIIKSEGRENQGQPDHNHRYSHFGGEDFVSSKDAPDLFFSSIRGPHLHNNKLDSQKQSKCGREYNSYASFSLPSSSFEPQRFSLGSAERRKKILSYSWEPSIPFQPSFVIPPTFTYSSELYDPIRDSIDLPGDELYKLSSSYQGSYQRTYGDSDNRHTPLFYDQVQDKILGKSCYSTTRSSPVVGVGTVGNSLVIVRDKTMKKEENASGSSHFKNSPKTKKTVINFDARHQGSGPLHSMNLMQERGKLSDEIVVESKINGDIEKESKLFRHFRVSLIEFVKELLKPTWRQGRLSKDAHNIIVKKSVQKVLSTLRPAKIPSDTESVKQYLSSAHPKISKLMEGYVVKYGKS